MIQAAWPALKAGMDAAGPVLNLAKAAPLAPVLNIAKIHALEVALLSVVVLSLGITAAVRGHNGRFAKVLEMLAVVLVALLVVGLATGGNFEKVSASLFGTIF